MLCSSTLRLLANNASAKQAGTLARCEAANFRWEQAVSEPRANEYGQYLELSATSTHVDWKAEHKAYLSDFVQIAKDIPRAPETFMAVNHSAHLREDLDDTVLIRLESLGGMVSHSLLSVAIGNAFWERFFNSQKDLRKDKPDPQSEALRTQFVAAWNHQRAQARPLFATFLNDFGGNLDALLRQDWPHLLRDHLGLTHWPSQLDAPLPVALMCFKLSEVKQARLLARKKGAVASFARPTVLDTEMSAAFVPAPLFEGGESYGHTLDLGQTDVPSSFTPELLAFPFPYQPKHIKALGYITRQHALQQADGQLDAQAMLTARNRHVQGLRQLPDCANFAEVLE